MVLYITEETLFLNTTIFINNTARRGAAIWGSLSSVLNVIHSVFKRNKIEKYGGIIFLQNTFNVNISQCLFTENYSRGYYGVTITVFSGNKVTVSNTEFTNNTANNGGAIYAYFISILNVVQCVFKRNRAIDFGGALYSFNTSTINILQCLFTENHAGFAGGAIYSDFEDKLIVRNTEFISNTVKLIGAALFAKNLIIVCSSFMINKARHGGAIYVRGSLDIKIPPFNITLLIIQTDMVLVEEVLFTCMLHQKAKYLTVYLKTTWLKGLVALSFLRSNVACR